MATFQESLDDCAFRAYEKQFRLAALIGEHDWLLDADGEQITFDSLVFRVHFLGTEPAISNTWQWADANVAMSLPPASLEMCRRVRFLGQQLGVDEFSLDRFALIEEVGKPTGHTLAMVSACLADASCYYRCPHENGAVYIMVKDARIDSQSDLDLERFSQAFGDLIWVPGNMKRRLISYLSAKGYIPGGAVGAEIRCQLYRGEQVSFSFKETAEGGVEIGFSR